MENKKEIKEKYYLVTLSDGTKNIINDGFSEEKVGFNELLKAYAVEENNELRTLIGNKLILDASKNYNANIFDIRTFVEGNYSLFAISKEEVTINEVSKKLHFITRADTTRKNDDLLIVEKKTKEEAKKQYEELLKVQELFSEEINKGRRR